MKLIAQINDCRQFSPDSFEDVVRLLNITEETTIKEIMDWGKKYRLPNPFPIHIVEAEDTQK